MLLDEEAYLATMADPMREIGSDQDPAADIWPYVALIPPADLEGFVIDEGIVERVYRSPDDRFDHVLIPTRTANVLLVIVVSRLHARVHGHHLLNLAARYGLPPQR